MLAEVEEICLELGIPDSNEHIISVGEIKKAILDHHDRHLVEEVAKSKKMSQHKQDNFKQVQEYMKEKSVDKCRLTFRIRSEMVKSRAILKTNTGGWGVSRPSSVMTAVVVRFRPRATVWSALTGRVFVETLIWIEWRGWLPSSRD